MSFKYSAEQEELRDLIRRFLSDNVDREYLANRFASDESSDPDLLEKLEELGLFEYFAGDDESKPPFLELVMVAHESGRVLLPENLIDWLYLGAFMGIGELPLEERRVGFGKSFQGGLITGKSTQILFFDSEGGLRSLDLASEGVTVAPITTVDQSLKRSLDKVDSETTQELSSADSSKIKFGEMILRAAEIAGIMEKVTEMTVEYIKERRQFDLPIGGFQAVQHRTVDMFSKAEALKSLVQFAGWAYDNSPEQLELAGFSAIQYGIDHGAGVVEGAIQMHGGIGFTYEHELHYYLRRIKFLEPFYKLSDKDIDQFIETSRRD